MPNAKSEDGMHSVNLESKRVGKNGCIVIMASTSNVVNGRCNDFAQKLDSLFSGMKEQKHGFGRPSLQI